MWRKGTLVNLASYNRKRSNLLLITPGPSSAGPPDGEEDSGKAKFSHLAPLITSLRTEKPPLFIPRR